MTDGAVLISLGENFYHVFYKQHSAWDRCHSVGYDDYLSMPTHSDCHCERLVNNNNYIVKGAKQCACDSVI